MQPTICVLIAQAPYGTVAAAEAVRHVNGALAEGFAVVAALAGDGVWLARAGQQADQGGFLSLSDALAAALGQATGPGLRVVVHGPSLGERGLAAADLIPGVEQVDDTGLAAVITASQALLRF